jgi:Transposase
MNKARFTKVQIIEIQHELETGVGVTEICRNNGVSSPRFYKSQAKYGGQNRFSFRRDFALFTVAHALRSNSSSGTPRDSELSCAPLCEFAYRRIFYSGPHRTEAMRPSSARI